MDCEEGQYLRAAHLNKVSAALQPALLRPHLHLWITQTEAERLPAHVRLRDPRPLKAEARSEVTQSRRGLPSPGHVPVMWLVMDGFGGVVRWGRG